MKNIDNIYNRIVLKELNNIDATAEKAELSELFSDGIRQLSQFISNNTVDILEQEYSRHLIRNAKVYQNSPDYPIEKYKYFLKALEKALKEPTYRKEDIIGYRRTLDTILSYIEERQLPGRKQKCDYSCQIEKHMKCSEEELLGLLQDTIHKVEDDISYYNIEDVAYDIKDIIFVLETM